MAENPNLWQDCAEWLVQCQVLPPNHRVTWPNAQLLDLARTLQDGAILCQLLHILKPGCINLKDANLAPKLSEFACLKNARLFLDTCRAQFGMRPNQLFEPTMLAELGNFLEVLKCLSELSQTQPVRARGFPMFPRSPPAKAVEYYNVDAFKNLEQHSVPDEDEDAFNSALQTTQDEDHAYEDLCYIRVPQILTDKFPEPRDKRDHCLKELFDTERNYVEALKLIIEHFMRPVQAVLNSDEVLTIFINIEDLAELHEDFFKDLRTACLSRNHAGRMLKECFAKWRMKFTMYGRYCASLIKAQQRLDELMAKSEDVACRIKKCQNDTNDGKFRLRDLLSLPMQRILKYHLLLRELKKHSTNTSLEDQGDLQAALDIMLDVAVYINEVKRDNEMIDWIKAIENSIQEFEMPGKQHFTEWGRLLQDGQVRFRPHETTTPKTRHIFVFDRVMLVVKQTKNDQYCYKSALNLSDFNVDETVPAKSLRDKWSHQWHIYNHKDQVGYTMAVKTEELRRKWIDNIKLALENLNPPGAPPGPHSHLEYCTFPEPALCAVCGKLLRGQFFQGYRCPRCHGGVHKECIPQFRECFPHRPSVPARSLSSVSMKFNGSHRHSSGSTLVHSPTGRSPRAMSISSFPSSLDRLGGSLDGGTSASTLRHSDSLMSHDEEAENVPGSGNGGGLQVPNGNRHSLLTPSPHSPGSPFSPAVNGHFTYKNEEDEQLSLYPWFAGFMDREKAEEILQRFPNGTFLLRISVKGETYKAISVKFENKVRHIRILKHSDNETVYLAPNKYFRSVLDLILWYQNNSLETSFQGMTTTLKTPYKRALLPQISDNGTAEPVLARAIVRYGFSATSPNMLTINVGDEVEVIGKKGEQRGWWKGRCKGKIGYFPLSYVEEIKEAETQ
ncbi:protein vav-like [Paramacrobiotus metropolitanus]|uniref:protein vav-like n=1 Tax=Paramacrobiotus metropolitanus TaxID=2943436 RepID=UPI0024462440|nr:protein vav-like [Paramacrobiotus metropolitanus]